MKTNSNYEERCYSYKYKKRSWDGWILSKKRWNFYGSDSGRKKIDGRPNIKAFYGKTESEVKKKLREFRRNQDKYQPNNICRVTLGEYICNWLYNFKRNNL